MNTDSVCGSPCAKCNGLFGIVGRKINARPGGKTVRIKASIRAEQDRNKRPQEVPVDEWSIGRCDRWTTSVIIGGFDGF